METKKLKNTGWVVWWVFSAKICKGYSLSGIHAQNVNNYLNYITIVLPFHKSNNNL